MSFTLINLDRTATIAADHRATLFDGQTHPFRPQRRETKIELLAPHLAPAAWS